MLNNNWFTQEINKVRDTKLALTTEATGALSNSGRCPTYRKFLSIPPLNRIINRPIRLNIQDFRPTAISTKGIKRFQETLKD